MKPEPNCWMKSAHGFSMIEVALSIMIMVLVSCAVMNAITSGNRDTRMIQQKITTARDSEMLIEELILEPIETRELSFDGFEQKAGELTDFLDNPLPEINQAYERWIEIQESSISVDFGSITSVNCLVYNIFTQDNFTGSEQFPVMIPMEAVP
tara:strand:+ start:175728 stop:176186 length:459 start_codon:yes stop_codon:yes gene_type:complete